MRKITVRHFTRTLLIGIPFFFTVGVALAQSSTAAPTSVAGVIALFVSILQTAVVPLLLALGLVYFLIGVLKYVTAGESEDKAKEGRNLMIYGIIALFVMISVFGLVQILLGTFSSGGAPGFTFGIPTLPSQ